jgi:hypothetical protein
VTQALRIDRLEKNYFINGACDLFQRAGIAAAVNLTITPTYSAPDRFKVSMSSAAHFTGTPTVQRQEFAPANGLTRYCMQFSGNASSSSGAYFATQRIESFLARELSGQTASFGVYAYSESATVVQITVRVANAFDDFSATTQVYQSTKTISASSAWTLASFEGVSIPTTANKGIEVEFQFQTMSVTGLTKLHRFTQFMANVGSKLSSFGLAGRNFMEEVLLAQRYYEKSYPQGVLPGTASAAGYIQSYLDQFTTLSGRAVIVYVPFRALKRTTPTVVTYGDSSGSSSAARVAGGDVTPSLNIGDAGFTLSGTSGTPSSAGTVAFQYTADAEL